MSLLVLSLTVQFVTAMESISGNAIVTSVSGEILEGKQKNSATVSNGLISFKLADNNGSHHKFKAADVKELKINVNDLA